MPLLIPVVRSLAGAAWPSLGLGTWRMGEDPVLRRREIAALSLGFDLGMTLVDTAEMYADGRAEEITAEAIRHRRDEIVVVSKVLPQNASRRGTVEAAERSLRRLGTDRIDLYLLHWPGPHPLGETLEAFESLRLEGKILHHGLSNFDTAEMESALTFPGGAAIAADQVLYNLERRGVERKLLPWCQRRGIVVMAYSPLEQGRLTHRDGLARIARRHGATPEQIALAWTLRHEGLVAVPKAADPAHVRENAASAALCLTEEDLLDIDRDFPPPTSDAPLATL